MWPAEFLARDPQLPKQFQRIMLGLAFGKAFGSRPSPALICCPLVIFINTGSDRQRVEHAGSGPAVKMPKSSPRFRLSDWKPFNGVLVWLHRL
jgi:hypothetical protein